MSVLLRLRLRLAFLTLAGLLVPIGPVTVRASEYSTPKLLAPQAVALVKRYLAALQAGNTRRACRLFDVPSVCAGNPHVRIQKFTVSPAERTVDGVQVPATIDDEDALFQLELRRDSYRIVDLVANPGPPVLEIGAP
jgi:hypothetical protein